MKQKSPGLLRPFVLATVLLSGLAASTLGASKAPILAVGTFQREVDTPSPGPSGTALLEEKGSNQIFSITVNNLVGTSYGLFVGPANTTNSLIFLIGPMSLQGTNNSWVLKYQASGAPPAELGVTNMTDLAGQYLLVANPGNTNIVNGVTNEIVEAVLFTRIPAFTTKAAAPHYNRKTQLTVPPVAPPNPHEKGSVRTIYTGSQGRSVFNLSAAHLSGGGSYSVFIEDPPASSIMSNIGALVISTNNIHSGTYSRDTRRGETLPLESPTVRDLSGRAIEIQDAFGEIHLEGTIP